MKGCIVVCLISGVLSFLGSFSLFLSQSVQYRMYLSYCSDQMVPLIEDDLGVVADIRYLLDGHKVDLIHGYLSSEAQALIEEILSYENSIDENPYAADFTTTKARISNYLDDIDKG